MPANEAAIHENAYKIIGMLNTMNQYAADKTNFYLFQQIVDAQEKGKAFIDNPTIENERIFLWESWKAIFAGPATFLAYVKSRGEKGVLNKAGVALKTDQWDIMAKVSLEIAGAVLLNLAQNESEEQLDKLWWELNEKLDEEFDSFIEKYGVENSWLVNDNPFAGFWDFTGDWLYDAFYAAGTELYHQFDYIGGFWFDFAISVSVNGFFNSAKGLLVRRDPLALDLNGDGTISTVSADERIMFDHGNDSGMKQATGWIAPEDGLLVFDRNGDGVINDGSELFGGATPDYNPYIGEATGPNSGPITPNIPFMDGFRALGQEDSNHDGVINHLDANWSKLQVWQDLNQDGISQADELFTLDELGITEIQLGKKPCEEKVEGGMQTAWGTFLKEDGSIGDFGQFDLDGNPFYQNFLTKVEISDSMAELPNVAGSGALRSLLEAAAWEANGRRLELPEGEELQTDSPIQNYLNQFSTAETRYEQKIALEGLLYAWANTSGFTSSLSWRLSGCGSGAYHVRQYNVPNDDRAAWERKIHILEAFNGEYLFSGFGASAPLPLTVGDAPIEEPKIIDTYQNPEPGKVHGSITVGSGKIDIHWNITQIEYLNKAYKSLEDQIYLSLAAQTRLKPLLEMVELTFDEETLAINFDFSKAEAHLKALLAEDKANGLADLVDFTRILDKMLFTNNWAGHEMIMECVSGWEMTDELRALYAGLGLLAAADGQAEISNSLSDILIGNSGDNTLRGNEFDEALYGGDGNDRLYGGAGDDILSGGAGDDYLEGGEGNDIYLFGRGHGHDTVANHVVHFKDDKYDRVRLIGLGPDEVEFLIKTRPASPSPIQDLVIRIKDSGETMTILQGASGDYNYQIQIVEFGDGSIWTMEDIMNSGLAVPEGSGQISLGQSGVLYGRDGDDYFKGSAGNDKLYGGAGNDQLYGNAGHDLLDGGDGDDWLYGGAGNDILDGGAGDDYLNGGMGSDTFIFGPGYGHDTVEATTIGLGDSPDKHDKVRLLGLTPKDVEFSQVRRKAGISAGYCLDLVIRLKETGETLTILNGASADFSSQIQSIEFDGSIVWSWKDIRAKGFEGSAGNDDLVLFESGILYGHEGDDTLTGSSGNDTLYGGLGDDRLEGGAGNDILDGGAGDDYLIGGLGSDTFIFGRGYGHDKAAATVIGLGDSADKHDKVRLLGLSPNEVEFLYQAGRNGGLACQDLVIRIKDTGETLTILSGLENSRDSQMQSVEFGDGTVWTMDDIWQNGIQGMGTIYLHAPGTLYGSDGRDDLYGSSGNDIIYGGDSIDYMVGRAGDDILYGEGDNDYLFGDDGNDLLDGGAGNDKLYGGNGDDILIGGTGNDHMEGGAGNDTYIIRPGDGRDYINNAGGGDDLLKFEGVSHTDLWFSRDSAHLVIGIAGSRDSVTLHYWYFGEDYYVDSIEAGGMTIAQDQLALMVQAMAGLGAPKGVDGGWTDTQREALEPIIASYWLPKAA